MILRDYQRNSIEKIRESFLRGNKRVVLQLPTGSGKTALAADILYNTLFKGKKALFIADMISLVEQTSNVFDKFELPHAIIQAQNERFDLNQNLQVCSIQTLNRREFPKADLIIIDEVHCLHDAHKRLMDALPDAYVIGLSATPWAKGLGLYFDDLIIGATVEELIEQGFLVDTRIYAPYVPNLSKIKIVNGDYDKKPLADFMDNKVLVGDIVDHWLRLGENRQTLCYAVNVAHSKHIAEMFTRAGVVAEHIDGYMTGKRKELRKEIIEHFKAGNIKILSSVGVLTKGFDYPGASCLIIARPTKSLMLHYQIHGRGIRPHPASGKTDCLILDHSGNYIRPELVGVDLPTTLDMGEKPEPSEKENTKPEKLPTVCKNCNFVKPAGVGICPVCGYLPQKKDLVENTDGELVEIKKSKITKEDKQRFYSELLTIQRERGYKDGWKSNVYRKKFDCWPKGLEEVPAENVSEETRNYIQHLLIRYAKGKNKITSASAGD